MPEGGIIPDKENLMHSGYRVTLTHSGSTATTLNPELWLDSPDQVAQIAALVAVSDGNKRDPRTTGDDFDPVEITIST